MKSTTGIVLKMINFAALGAACGVVLAAIGNVISSSPTTVVFTIVACALPGIYQRNLVGIILGSFSGALLAAVGSLIGGTTLGVAMTTFACSLLGIMIGWADDRDTMPQPAIAPQPTAKVDIARATEWSSDGTKASFGFTPFSASWHWFEAWLLESYDCGEWVHRPIGVYSEAKQSLNNHRKLNLDHLTHPVRKVVIHRELPTS